MTKSAIQSMHTRHFGVMEVNDYSQSFGTHFSSTPNATLPMLWIEFELKQTLPFASESRHSVSDGALLIPPVVRIPPEDEAPARPTTKKRKRKQTPPNSSDTAFVAPPPPKQSAWTIQRDRRDTRKGPGSLNAAPSSRVKIQAALVAPGLVDNASISAPAPICGQSKQRPPLAGHTTDLPQTSAPNRPSLALASASVVAGVVANTVKVPSNSVRNSRVVSAPPAQGLLTRAAAARQALQAAETTLASTSTPA
ncbi:hypothetical protein B0H10DRAFT_724485 [Mycena sp. CBHHK59/15]|nr:hypothetical protein B0H10DRAFT_724485 [Mycena sp. CBHHK59/15]